MTTMINRFLFLLVSATIPAFTPATAAADRGLIYHRTVERLAPVTIECDVAVYGGTPGGTASAIQAARMGKKVALLSFDRHVGGLTTAGLTATDVGNKGTIGGLAAEFYQRVGKLRDFSPSLAENVFLSLLDESKVTVLRERPLESVAMDGSRIISITMETGETIRASMFIDATYEGDLFAAAGVSYHVGREPSATYGESLGGQWQSVAWKSVYQFCDLPIDPFKTPGDPSSGLLPGISPHPHGQAGEGDYRVQAYNFRMFLSDAENRIPFPKPIGYDPGRYALLERFMNSGHPITWTLNYTVKPMTDGPVQMRNGDSNNAGSFSSNNVNGSNLWPDGTFEPLNFATLPPPRRGLPIPLKELYQLREKIFQDHVNYQQGYMYFLANDPRVPKDLRERVNRFGLDANEFKDTGSWPHQLYVREGRRMVSDYVMTQADCEARRAAPDSVGLASYNMDSHPCQRVVVVRDGVTTVRNEGAFGQKCARPYPVSYRSIVPKKSECSNLLVPVCLSSSHVAFGSIRMEPVYMILGQSAGTAAALAIDGRTAIQDINYPALRQRLLRQGQVLEWPEDEAAMPEEVPLLEGAPKPKNHGAARSLPREP